jgi:hypothetical protein
VKRWYHIVIAVIVLFAVTYYLDQDIKQQNELEEKEELSKFILTMDWTKQNALQIDTEEVSVFFEPVFPDGVKQLTAENAEPAKWTWKITKPIAAKAAVGDVQSYWQTFKDLKIIKEIEDKPENLARFGLDKSAQNVLIFTFFDDDGRESTFLVGDQNPAKSGNYAMVGGSNKVYLVEQRLNYLKNKKLDYFRQKEVVKFDNNDVERIEYKWQQDESIVLVRNGAEWLIEKPFPGHADSVKVNGFLADIKNARAEGFPSEKASEDAKKFGLEKPRGTIGLYMKPSKEGVVSQPITLVIGSQTLNKPFFYIRRSDAETVFRLKKYLSSKLTIKFHQLVSPDLADFLMADLNNLSVENFMQAPAAKLLLSRKQDSAWTVGDGNTEYPADQNGIGELVRALQEISGNRFVRRRADKTEGFDKPLLRFVLGETAIADGGVQKNDNDISITFASQKGANGKTQYYAQGGKDGFVFSIDEKAFDKIKNAEAKIVDRTVIADIISSNQLKLRSPRGEIVLKKGDKNWKIAGGDASAALKDGTNPDLVVNFIKQMKVEDARA